MSKLDQLNRLVAVDEVKTLLATYCHAFDRKDDALFMSIWTEAARYQLLPRGGASGPEEIRDFVNTIWSSVSKTHHHITNPIVKIGHNTATAIADVIYFRQTVDGVAALLSGTYECTAEKIGGHWYMSELTFQGFDTQSPEFK